MPLNPTENVGNETPSYHDQLAGQKADTRRRVLDAARDVFLRVGFMDANLNEVAAGAGVGKGTLYRHFDNKAELYVAMLSEHADQLAKEMASVIDRVSSPLKQIEQVAGFYLEFWSRHPEYFQLVWAVQNQPLLGPLSPELQAHLRRVFEAPLRLLEGLIRNGIAAGEVRPVDAWDTANALALSANAIVGQIVIGSPQVVERDLGAVYRQLQDLFIAGLVAAPEPDPR